METQPIAIGMLFLSLVLTIDSGNISQIEPWTLNSAIVTLLLLWLHWWTMLARFIPLASWSQRQKQTLHLLGPALAIIVMAFVLDPLDLIVVSIFILIFWRLSIFLTAREYRDERLVVIFRIGMIALMGMLIFSVLMQLPSIMLATLATGLPIFFFSGLIALSFTRLSIINQENARLPGSAQANSTRNWFIILTCLWGLVVSLSLLLETFAFSLFQAIMQPIFYLFSLLIYYIFYLFFLLASLFTRLFGTPHISNPPPMPQSTPIKPPPSQVQHVTAFSSLFTILRWLLLVIAVILLIIVIRAILRSILTAHHQESEEDEVRESLSLRDVLAERRQQRQEQHIPIEMDNLDPQSVRARYRELLQAVAQHNRQLARQQQETPIEYEQRLSRQAQLSQDESIIQLRELTQAYQEERYAGMRPVTTPLADFRTWLERFIRQLTS